MKFHRFFVEGTLEHITAGGVEALEALEALGALEVTRSRRNRIGVRGIIGSRTLTSRY